MFSLAGIPPLLGFYSKFVVFQATVEAGLVAFAAIAIAASVIGAFYYIKFVKVMFFDEPAGVVKGVRAGPRIGCCSVLTAAIISPLGLPADSHHSPILADKAAAGACSIAVLSQDSTITLVEETGSTNVDLAWRGCEPDEAKPKEGDWLRHPASNRQAKGRQGREMA